MEKIIDSKTKCCATCEHFSGSIIYVVPNKTKIKINTSQEAQCIDKKIPEKVKADDVCPQWHMWYPLHAYL
jgi:hypothetical protein